MDESVAQFVAVTSASPEVAQQFLAQAGGNVEQAVGLFFAAGEEDEGEEVQAAVAPPPVAAPAPARSAPSSSSGGPRIGTLGGLSKGNEDSDDDDDKQDLYAGGGKSGLNVQDPSKGKKGDDLKRELLQKAQEGSLARQKLQAETPKPSSSAFRGGGNTLGGDDVESRHVPDPTARPARRTGGMPGSLGDDDDEMDEDDDVGDDEDARITRTLTLWREGFTVEDGPLLRYEDHKAELEQLRDGRAPLHLLGVRLGQRVDVNVANRDQESYAPPPKVHKPFGGEGNRLGAPTPTVTPATASSDEQPTEATPSGNAAPPRNTAFQLNANEPTTQIQIRLADGSRVVGKFNHTHTVGDVQSYINASHAGLASRPYVLQTTFPNRDLTDLTQTVKDAQLLGSVVTMRYT